MYTRRVSLFRVNVIASNPKDENRQTLSIAALVDTRSELTWLPAPLLTDVGILPRRKRTFITARKRPSWRERRAYRETS
jgi:hypothetical protein